MAAAAARRASVCSRSRRGRAARISRTRRAAPERAKLICRGMARPACSQMASAEAGSHSAIVSSITTAANSRRRSAPSAALRPSAISTSMPSCTASTAAQLRAPSTPVTIRMLISNSSLAHRPARGFGLLRSARLFFPLGACEVSRYWSIGAIGPDLSPGSLLFPKRVGDAVFLQLAVEGGLADAQQLGGLELVAVEGTNGSQDGLAFHIRQRGQLRRAGLGDGLAGGHRASGLETLLLQQRRQV